ncbi:MAG: stage III sporulation protein AF [Clostridia bacterium]|nr:stage III sporulation protein AF [Clostridia bacterium]MDD4386955.1 stage III sporulation protein AF [Clostridia bacterium]
MIETFKNWISTLLCIGIFISILELILPKSKIKKYIYVLVGIVTTITIISPGINLFKNNDIAKSVSSVVDNFSSNVNINNNTDLDEYNKNQENIIKDQFIDSLKKDIESNLTLRGVNVIEVYISLAENYDIQKIRVKTKSLSTASLSEISKVIEYIKSQYDIDYSKIEVIESGD